MQKKITNSFPHKTSVLTVRNGYKKHNSVAKGMHQEKKVRDRVIMKRIEKYVMLSVYDDKKKMH